MYSWLFRKLPGPRGMKIALSIIILAAVLFALVTFVFPWVAELTKFTESTIGASSQKTGPTPSGSRVSIF